MPSIFGYPTIPYPETAPRIVAPVFGGLRAGEDMFGGVAGVVGSGIESALEPVPLTPAPEPPVAMAPQYQRNPLAGMPPDVNGILQSGADVLGLQPPTAPSTPFVDAAVGMGGPGPSPDQAAAMFAGGRPDSAAQIAADTPDWGGVSTAAGTGLTQGQIAQDAIARNAIEGRHVDALSRIARSEAENDPMDRQIAAQQQNAKFELLQSLPQNLYATEDAPGAFFEEEGVIKNAPPGPRLGQILERERAREKAMYDPRMFEFQREGASQGEALAALAQFKQLNDTLDAMKAKDPARAGEIDARRAAAEKYLYAKLQALTGKNYAGWVSKDPFALPPAAE